jgi:CspA family cold shock protein
VIRATVETWTDDEGWGVLSAPEVPGGIWAHFSAVEAEGFRKLSPGQIVEVEFEDLGSPYQDGYRFRAERVRPVTTS